MREVKGGGSTREQGGKGEKGAVRGKNMKRGRKWIWTRKRRGMGVSRDKDIGTVGKGK